MKTANSLQRVMLTHQDCQGRNEEQITLEIKALATYLVENKQMSYQRSCLPAQFNQDRIVAEPTTETC